MSHYDTLGVAKDATAEEIKQAWRRMSSRAHPDKGGSDEEQQAVNRAYEVLCDPERRSRYDATGSDGSGKDPDAGAMSILVELFTKGLERVEGDLVQFVESQIRDAIEEGQSRISGWHKLIARMKRRRPQVKSKSEKNLVHDIIDAKISQAETNIAGVTKAIADAQRALELLADFEYVGEPAVSTNSFDRMFEAGILKQFGRYTRDA